MRNIFPTILIIISIALFFAFTKPVIDDMNSLRADTAIYNEALGNATQLIKVRDELLKKYNQQFATEDVARLTKFLPDSIDNVRLLIELNGIAQRHGLDLRNVRVGAQASAPATGIQVNPDKYNVLKVGFAISSSYEVFKRFLDDLEHGLRLVDINSVSFTSADKDQYEFVIDLNTYWLK